MADRIKDAAHAPSAWRGANPHDPRPLGGGSVAVEHGGSRPLGVIEQERRVELRCPAQSALVHPGPDGAFGVIKLNGVGGHIAILLNRLWGPSGHMAADLGFTSRDRQQTPGQNFSLTQIAEVSP